MVYCNASLSEAQAGNPAGIGAPPLLSGYFPEVYGAVAGALGVVPAALRWVCLPSLPAMYAELAGTGVWGCDVVLAAPMDVYLLSEGVNFSRSVYDESYSILVPVRSLLCPSPGVPVTPGVAPARVRQAGSRWSRSWWAAPRRPRTTRRRSGAGQRPSRPRCGAS